MMSLVNISERLGQLGLCKHLKALVWPKWSHSYYTLADIPSSMSKVTSEN